MEYPLSSDGGYFYLTLSTPFMAIDQSKFNFEITEIVPSTTPGVKATVYFKNTTDITEKSLNGLAIGAAPVKGLKNGVKGWSYSEDEYKRLEMFILHLTGHNLIQKVLSGV